jgi:hypothetical protein
LLWRLAHVGGFDDDLHIGQIGYRIERDIAGADYSADGDGDAE